MKKFAFVSDAAEKEYKELPDNIQYEFGVDLRRLQLGEKPELKIEYLKSVGAGVVELKINGHPAHRCIYVAKYMDTVVVLHSFSKTTNHVDRQAIKVATQRMKELQTEMRASSK